MQSPPPPRTNPLALLVALAFTTSCASIRSAPVVPIPMHLTAKTEFLLHQPADSTGAAGSQCALLRAEIEVDSVRADTLFVRRLLNVSQVRGVTRCRGVGAGIVVASENPALRAQTGAGSQSGTFMAYLIGGALFVTSALVFAYMMIGS